MSFVLTFHEYSIDILWDNYVLMFHDINIIFVKMKFYGKIMDAPTTE